MSISVGSSTIEWDVTVRGGDDYPVAGFSVSMTDLTVKITPTAQNATTITYDFGDGSDLYYSSAVVSYTYEIAGTYTITQTVNKSLYGIPIQVTYKTTVTVTEPAEEEESILQTLFDDPIMVIATVALVLSIVGMIALPMIPKPILAIVALIAGLIMAVFGGFIAW
jgi:hypothetical protein